MAGGLSVYRVLQTRMRGAQPCSWHQVAWSPYPCSLNKQEKPAFVLQAACLPLRSTSANAQHYKSTRLSNHVALSSASDKDSVTSLGLANTHGRGDKEEISTGHGAAVVPINQLLPADEAAYVPSCHNKLQGCVSLQITKMRNEAADLWGECVPHCESPHPLLRLRFPRLTQLGSF